VVRGLRASGSCDGVVGPVTDRHTDFSPRRRGAVSVRADALTWQHALFAVECNGRTVYLLRGHRDAADFIDALDAGRLDGELRSLFDRPPRKRLTRRAARRATPAVATGMLVGLEHEFSLFDGSSPVDFRRVIHTLAIDGVRADPSDPNAYRCPWGGVITCDGAEAEVAIPPVDVTPGFVDLVLDYANRGEGVLRGVLPDLRLVGFSTHLSVSLAVRNDRRFAQRYARTFAPALMLLMDRVSSPGLLVRPRPGRLELCGEHVAGDSARAAAAFAVGSVRALAGARHRTLAELAVVTRTEPAIERFGVYVDRRGFGPDLYAEGRASVLRGADGTRRSAQRQLELAWAFARPTISGAASTDDLDAIDRAVRGDLPLPCEEQRA
jgi:hypothetical protein